VAIFVTYAFAALICGQRGDHDPNKLTYYMGNFFYRAQSTFTLCASSCKKELGKCKSFRYSYWLDANAQYCEFFANGLDGNLTAVDNTSLYYYDIGCAFPPYDPPTTTITSTLTQTPLLLAANTNTTYTQKETQSFTTTSIQSVTETQTVISISTRFSTATETKISTLFRTSISTS
ncbi:hypothetical protein GQ44DRAFT_577130, partial [Phaeosphaeriaceae sp. PMI808]